MQLHTLPVAFRTIIKLVRIRVCWWQNGFKETGVNMLKYCTTVHINFCCVCSTVCCSVVQP